MPGAPVPGGGGIVLPQAVAMLAEYIRQDFLSEVSEAIIFLYGQILQNIKEVVLLDFVVREAERIQ